MQRNGELVRQVVSEDIVVSDSVGKEGLWTEELRARVFMGVACGLPG